MLQLQLDYQLYYVTFSAITHCTNIDSIYIQVKDALNLSIDNMDIETAYQIIVEQDIELHFVQKFANLMQH